ncbi:hypothetical protein MBANPS3_004857 [Mucor bainieri]
MPAAWHKLPFEVLTYIFEHNIDDPLINVRQSSGRLCRYQLVCRGWSKAAQSLLYRRVDLQDSIITEGLQRFVQFVYTIKVLAPQLGSLVKAITVCKGLDHLEEPLTALDAIFNACPKLEEFYCIGSSKEVAWPYMLTLPDVALSNIRCIVEEKESREYSPLYPFLAFKLKRSLSQLHYVKIEQVPSWESKYLLDNLSQFVSLQQLSFLQCTFNSSEEFSKVIDACSTTVSKLFIQQYVPLSTMEASKSDIANPNLSIKEISIDGGIMDSILYLADKFKNLQKLTMNQIAPLDMTDHVWIRGLTDLCCSLKEFNLCFNAELEGSIKDRCVDLIKRASSPKGTTYLTIDYIGASEDDQFATVDGMVDLSSGITLRKDGIRSGIDVSLPWIAPEEENEVDDEFDYHTHWLDNYSPNRIEIKHIEMIDFMNSDMEYKFLSRDETDWKGFAGSFIFCPRTELIEAKSWTILAKALFSTVGTKDAHVSFSEMIIYNCGGIRQHLVKSSDPNVKQLTFTNSILYYNAFPIISGWLPTLDTLILNSCFLMIDESFTLKINMPDTTLRHIQIIVGPVSFVDGLPYTATVGKHLFRNADLVRALSPGQQCTLRLDINGKSTISTLRDNTRSPVKFQKKKNYHGTSDNFFIWIRCKGLKTISIIDGTNGTEWNKLPHEILLSIFKQINTLPTDTQYTAITDDDVDPKQDLYRCQLVCRGWSQPAQRLLYQSVGCRATHDHDASAGMCRFQAFLCTIKSLAPHLGAHVKKITICNSLQYIEDPRESLKLLFEACPNIEELYTHDMAVDVVWSHLLAEEKSRLPRLKSILKNDERVTSTLYLRMAEKFKSSLVSVHFSSELEESLSEPLTEMIHEFPSLTTICMVGYSDGSGPMSQIVDRCNAPRIEKLDTRIILEDRDYTNVVIVPNYSVKGIVLRGPAYDGSLYYLANKFKGLEKFKCYALMLMDAFNSKDMLKELCMQAKEYYAHIITFTNEATTRHYSKLTTAMHTSNKQLMFYQGCGGTRINIRKWDSTSRLEVYTRRSDPFGCYTECLKEGFTSVEVKNISRMTDWDMMDAYADFETTRISRNSVLSFADAFKRYVAAQTRIKECEGYHMGAGDVSNIRSWKTFSELMSCTANTANMVMLLDSMIITDAAPEISPQETIHTSSIKQLTLINAIIYHQMFPLLSLSLPSVDTLILDSCYILMDDYYTMQLFMPSTKLRRLAFMVKPLPCVDYLSKKSKFARSQLENKDLLKAMSPGKQYSLRIEANGREYLYNVKDGIRSPVNKKSQKKQAMLRGSQRKFLIWIQCSELKELSIVDGTRSKNRVDHQFIPLE